MAKKKVQGNSANDESKPDAAAPQPDPAAAAEPVPAPKAKDQNDPKRKTMCTHEAAHAVVGHEVGGTVNWINVDGHPDQNRGRRAQINWPINPYQLKDVDKLDANAIEQARIHARNMVTCFVAGEVAEYAGTDKPLVSHPGRIPDHFWEASDLPKEQSDRGMIAWLLTSVGLFDIGEVATAEERAMNILQARKARHDFLVQKLLETGYVEPPVLTEGLGK